MSCDAVEQSALKSYQDISYVVSRYYNYKSVKTTRAQDCWRWIGARSTLDRRGTQRAYRARWSALRFVRMSRSVDLSRAVRAKREKKKSASRAYVVLVSPSSSPSPSPCRHRFVVSCADKRARARTSSLSCTLLAWDKKRIDDASNSSKQKYKRKKGKEEGVEFVRLTRQGRFEVISFWSTHRSYRGNKERAQRSSGLRALYRRSPDFSSTRSWF